MWRIFLMFQIVGNKTKEPVVVPTLHKAKKLAKKLNDCRRGLYESSFHILHTEKHYLLLHVTIQGWMTTDSVCALRSLKRSKQEVTVNLPPLFPKRGLAYMVSNFAVLTSFRYLNVIRTVLSVVFSRHLLSI